jgi:hypothetical protein
MQLPRSKANIEKKRKKRKIKLVLLPFILIVFIAGFFYYAFSPKFQISQITVSGESFVKKELLQQYANELLSQKLWGFIPMKSPLLIGKKYIEDSLYKKFPPIESIIIDIHDAGLFIEIKERKAVSVICTKSSLCYFLDKNGFVFSESPKFEGSSFVKIDTFESEIKIGNSIITSDALDKITKEISLFKGMGINIKSVYFESEDQANFISVDEMAFIIRRQDSLEQIEERLKALISSRPDVISGKYEYVDLRIDSKIFLKNKES